MTFKKEW